MNSIWNKLRQKNGASIFMGLMFLLVCLMVGTVVLTASTAASGKLSQQQQDEQEYLTVASAARLLKNRIGALTYTHVTTNGSPSSKILSASTGDVILETELEKLCEALVENSGSLDSEAGKAFEISAAEGSSDWEPVYGSLRMKSDGGILVSLWLGDSNETNPENHNRMELEFFPNSVVNTKTETITHTDPVDGSITETVRTIVTTIYSWPEGGCTITKGT